MVLLLHKIWMSVRYQKLSVCLGRYMIDKYNSFNAPSSLQAFNHMKKYELLLFTI